MESVPEPIAGLIRDHRAIEAVVAEALGALAAAVAAPGERALTDAAFEQLWLLQVMLEYEVAIHIQKEEEALFPVLRREIARLSGLVDDMLFEHDQIEEKRDLLRAALVQLDANHDAVQAVRAQLRTRLTGQPPSEPAAFLAEARETVQQLDWILQGHFTGEEDGLFLPAEELLSPETLAGMARRMATIEEAAEG